MIEEQDILSFAYLEGNEGEQSRVVFKVNIHKKHLIKAIENLGVDHVLETAKQSMDMYIYQALTPNFKGIIKTQTEIVKEILLNENEISNI